MVVGVTAGSPRARHRLAGKEAAAAPGQWPGRGFPASEADGLGSELTAFTLVLLLWGRFNIYLVPKGLRIKHIPSASSVSLNIILLWLGVLEISY